MRIEDYGEYTRIMILVPEQMRFEVYYKYLDKHISYDEAYQKLDNVFKVERLKHGITIGHDEDY